MFEAFLSQAAIRDLLAQEAASDKAQKRTAEQIEAIYSHGQNILVSASAGSGKTFVMVERIVDMIKRGVGVNQLFISTFTVKAAGELKERLEDKLSKALQATSDPALQAHLATQLAGVQTADIGTMDAFTQKLVNEHGYRLGLSPQFRILQDKSEQDILKKEVFDDLFEDYAAGPQAQTFKQLVRNFSGNRKDTKGFREVVDQVYTFVQSTPNPQAWLRDQFMPAASQPEQVLAQSRQSGLALLDDLDRFFRHHLDHEAQLFPKANYLNHVIEIVARLADIDLTADLASIEEAFRFVDQLASSSNGRGLTNLTRKDDTKEVKEAYNADRKVLIDQVRSWLAQVYQTRLVLVYQDGAEPLLELLRDFMRDFCDQYLQLKIAEHAIEFSDISHLAIKLLEDFPEVRASYQDRYVEVMVDEYQDTNHTQETLLELLSRGHNRFMVGDIKQSIYRFRQADPQIFNHKFKLYQEDPTAGQLILLKENFRSQTEVLEATNAVFTRLMDEDLGDLVYDQTHQLVAGSDRQQIADTANTCQYLLYSPGQEEVIQDEGQEGDSLVSQGEVDVVVKEIIALHQQGVPFGDMTLLVASRSRNDNILRTFDRHGIPLVADGGELTYLKSVDVMIMLDTLRAIDNPLRDYALVALLKSPMFDFSEDVLTRISLQGKGQNFYEKLLLALAGQGDNPQLITPSLAGQLGHFQKYLEKWRHYAKSHSLYDLIWTIYQDRLYYDHVGLLPNGDKRQANLYALALRANQFEKTGFKGLARFIRMIDRILETENDLASVEVAPPADAVSLMTIHKSKGLQFPYVFILNMDKAFDKRDERSKLVLSRNKGAGIRYLADLKGEFEPGQIDLPRVLVNLDTLAYQANQRELRLASLSEQMRLLYVAMTRAEKKVYLVGKGQADKLQDRFDGKLVDGRLPFAQREALASFQDWILAVLATDKTLPIELTVVTDADLTPDKIGELSAGLTMDSQRQAQVRQTEDLDKALASLELVEELNKTYRSAINLPTLRTPSQIKARYQPLVDGEALAVMETAIKPVSFDLPSFGQEVKVTGAVLGSAVHELMQRLVISSQVSLADLEKARADLAVPETVKAGLDLPKLHGFFETDLGQLLQAQHQNLVREAPFALLMTDEVSGEDFVVRGIVDGFLKLEDRLVLFDYKTDKYKNPADLVIRYQAQMDLYAQALKQAYGVEQVDKYLVLLGGEKVEILEVG